MRWVLLSSLAGRNRKRKTSPVDKRIKLDKISTSELRRRAFKRVREQAEFLHKLYHRKDENNLSTTYVDK
jgi:hypothetical protein